MSCLKTKEPESDRINQKVTTTRRSATKYSVDFRNVVVCQEDYTRWLGLAASDAEK
jgi:hypothetical protein